MDLEEIKRGLRAEIKKRENEQYFTFQCNVRQMCKDVLAKLEEQESLIAELKERIANGDKDFDMANSQNERLLKIVRHQKYKRCLAMARWCDEVMMSCELRGYAVHRIWANRHQWAMRWKYRWLELAKKFKDKEAK